MQRITADLLLAYETLIHQDLDGKPITSTAPKPSVAERDQTLGMRKI